MRVPARQPRELKKGIKHAMSAAVSMNYWRVKASALEHQIAVQRAGLLVAEADARLRRVFEENGLNPGEVYVMNDEAQSITLQTPIDEPK